MLTILILIDLIFLSISPIKESDHLRSDEIVIQNQVSDSLAFSPDAIICNLIPINNFEDPIKFYDSLIPPNQDETESMDSDVHSHRILSGNS